MALLAQGRADLFSSSDAGWSTALEQVPHDVYHTAAYHRIPGFGGQGQACLFSYREEDRTFLWPYLLSPLRENFNDVLSVYGYPGPVSRGGPEFVQRAWLALLDHWKMQGVVSAFTRFHPMLENHNLLEGVRDGRGELASGGCRPSGFTVSIDLSVPAEQQLRNYKKVLRQDIRKIRELGFVTEEDSEWRHTDAFVALYLDTMARRNSRSDYLIDSAWVNNFRQSMGDHARLFVTKWNGQVAAALLAIEYAPYLHAHLTGINRDMMEYSPLKVLLDDIRQWGTARGLRSFHLGGGLGGREDSLFQFKSKFSPLTHDFRTGAWILDRASYTELEAQHRRTFERQGIDIGDPGFFPIYRYQP